jgi:hypothetical protein
MTFHTSAAASLSSDDFIQFQVPLLQMGEAFLMEVGVNTLKNSFTTLFEGTLRIEDVTEGVLLGRFDQSGGGSLFLDLSERAGNEIRVSLTSDLAAYGPEGFGGGSESFSQRTFRTEMRSAFELRHVTVPEPSPAALIGVGLMGISLLAAGSARPR